MHTIVRLFAAPPKCSVGNRGFLNLPASKHRSDPTRHAWHFSLETQFIIRRWYREKTKGNRVPIVPDAATINFLPYINVVSAPMGGIPVSNFNVRNSLACETFGAAALGHTKGRVIRGITVPLIITGESAIGTFERMLPRKKLFSSWV